MRRHHDKGSTTLRAAAALAAGALATTALTALWAPPASAGPAGQRFTDPGSYIWTVPAGVDSVRLTLAGAQGGGDMGGKGAVATGILPVHAGQRLSVTVGGQGSYLFGGYGGGGNSGFGARSGWGGGGASRVVLDGHDVIVAGAGGGQAPASIGTWHAGGDSGSSGASRVYRCDGEGGAAGSSHVGGRGGGGGLYDGYCVVAGAPGQPGTEGEGGKGARIPFADSGWIPAGGGGGGGGFYGCGGGGSSGAGLEELQKSSPGPYGGAGGGGSSYINVSYMTGTVADGARSGNGMVDITSEDAWAPTSVPVVSPVLPVSAGGWYRSDVTVTWNWTDVGSGIDPARCPPTTIGHPDSPGVFLEDVGSTCADLSGNVASARVTLKFDTSPPQATPTYDPATDLTTWHWADAGSGIDPRASNAGNCPWSSQILRGHPVTCSERAGNVTTFLLPIHPSTPPTGWGTL